MFSFLKKFFGFGPKIDFATLVKNGAVIVDVRTKGEFVSGHIEGSVNMSTQDINSFHQDVFESKDQVIITCCLSGVRSISAKTLLMSKGYKNVHNGGGWSSLNGKIYN
jgi:phage shock protein E